MSDFASILSERRKELGLSQGDLAKRLHVTRQAVSKWENGKGIPEISILTDIAEVIGVSVDELLTGKEPEKQIIEKIVIQEKEVVKPMPVRKILAIVAPIVLVIVLASALMGVYIPKAIAVNTPPISNNSKPEPEPEIVYTEVYVKGKSNSDDSTFQAPLIAGKAYYSLVMQLSSAYTLYITAPKGAVATLNGEVIAEFDTAKTVEYKQYFKCFSFIMDEHFDENSGLHSEQYILGGGLVDSALNPNYVLEINMATCSEEDCLTEKQNVVLRQHYGFDDVIIPAQSTYFVALNTGDEQNAWHYGIKSSGIKYVRTYIHRTSFNYDVSPAVDVHPKKPVSEFYIKDYKGFIGDGKDCDRQLGFINDTDEDIKLELEEIPIEEILLGQEITIEWNESDVPEIIYKLKLDMDTVLMFDMFRNWSGGGAVTPPYEIYTYCNPERRNGSHIVFCPSYREQWIGYKYLQPTSPGWIYVVIRPRKDRVVTVVVDDWDRYYNEHIDELN